MLGRESVVQVFQGLAPRFQAAACCLFAGLVMAGCAASIQGAPPRLFPVATELNQVRQVLNLDWYGAYAKASGSDKQYYRDQAVFARMYAIDIAYSQYELALTRERQNVGFLSTLAQLGLSTSGTLLGGEETKTILAAASTGVTGTKEAYDKNILIERTISTLQQQMRAQRKFVKVKIIERLSSGTSAYPLEFALSDVEEYYRAGTITGALLGASEDAGTTLRAAESEERAVFEFNFSRTAQSRRIQKFYLGSPALQTEMHAWIGVRGFPNNNMTHFLSAGSDELHRQFILRFGVP